MAEAILESLSLDVQEIKAACETDLDTLGMVAAPDDVTLAFPPLFVELWMMLTAVAHKDRDFSKFCIGLPRGHGKTFFIKLFVLYCILFTKKNFILVIGASSSLAENIIADVIDMLDSPNIVSIFGNWRFSVEVDRQNFKKFKFGGRPVILKAAGAGTSIRGITTKNKRPDLMIFDDSQTDTCALSVIEAEKFITWFTGTAMKAKNPTSCTFIYIGNMYRDIEIKKGLYTCLLRNLQKNSSWKSFIVGGILADGQALWEELQPLEQLLEELQQDIELEQEEVFYAEVLNDPSAVSKRVLDTSKLVRFKKLDGDMPFGKFIIIDPASGKKNPKLDDLVIGYVEVYDGKPVLRQLKMGKLSPLQTIHESIKFCIQYGCSTIICEDVAYQSTLLFWFDHVLSQMGMTGVNLLPINPHGISKNSRIVSMFKSWQNDELRVDEVIHSIALAQAVKFNPLKSNNIDDILDIMAYSLQVLLEYPTEITVEVMEDTDYLLHQQGQSVQELAQYTTVY